MRKKYWNALSVFFEGASIAHNADSLDRVLRNREGALNARYETTDFVEFVFPPELEIAQGKDGSRV